MKHLVFVLGSYYPNYSAVGFCAHQVIECLKNDFRCTVVSIRSDLQHMSWDSMDSVRIIRVDTPERTRRLKLTESNGYLDRVLLLLHRVTMTLSKLVSRQTIERPLMKAYLGALESLDVPPDIVVPLVFPFETVLAALEYKKRRRCTMVIPYIFDNFVASPSLHVFSINRILKRRRHLALEQSMIEESDAVLAMHPMREHFFNHFEIPLLQKIRFLEHPLLSSLGETTSAPLLSTVTVTYTGSLINKVHDSDYLLKLIQALPVSSPLHVDFYLMGNKAYKVKDVEIEGRICIVNHGQVSKERSTMAIMQSNILLSLGEVRGKQISSKIFEYMSTGKPIVHLAYVENDSVSAILSKYPLALCLVQDDSLLRENARRCAVFIDRHKQSQLTFSDVAALFPEALPSTTADVMREIFTRVVK